MFGKLTFQDKWFPGQHDPKFKNDLFIELHDDDNETFGRIFISFLIKMAEEVYIMGGL